MTEQAIEADASAEAQVLPDANPATEETKPETEGEAQPAEKPVEEAFPKKAVNAISRRDKTIGKLRAEREQLARELETLRSQAKAPEAQEPKESEFDNYGDYLKAVAKYEAKATFREEQKEAKESQLKDNEQRWIQEREDFVEENSKEVRKSFPDFQDVMQENLDELRALKPHAHRAILEADNPAYALYMLAKEGSVESLNDMSEYRAAMTVARMEAKALQEVQVKHETKAPAPLASAKGRGAAQKTIHDLSPEQLVRDWLKL